MKPKYILYLSMLCVAVISCKQDTTTQQNEPEPITTQGSQPPSQAPGTASPSSQSTAEGHDYTFLTNKILHYKNAFAGKKAGSDQPFKDEWIDLIPDGTFKAGKLKEQTHTGKWSYNHDTKTLFLKPDDTRHKMSEWKVMYSEKMMVWVGTSTYGDNHIQIQLIWSDVLP